MIIDSDTNLTPFFPNGVNHSIGDKSFVWTIINQSLTLLGIFVALGIKGIEEGRNQVDSNDNAPKKVDDLQQLVVG